ncbi:MAG: cyclase family protein [Peptococcaceae bacterium]|nr:cyclase family protein [Peptococcaceae bacterium]
MTIYDITQPLFACAVYPGDPAPTLTQTKNIAEHGCNLSEIALCVHNGTHIDAPAHFLQGGAGVDRLPLDVFFGQCAVKAWDGTVPQDCERLLLKGDHILTAEDAQLIVQAGVKLIGVESQSVGDPAAPMEVHKILLDASVIPLEGLALREVAEDEYLLSALPLSLGADCDGSPVRAVLIK